MISTIIFLAYTALLSVIPFLEVYRPRWYRTLRRNMDYTTNGRRFMAYVLALMVIFFHMVFYAAFPSNHGIMVSTLFVFFFLSTKRTVQLLDWLNRYPTAMFALMVITLGISFISFLFPTSVTLAFLLQIACILPKEKPDNTVPFITITRCDIESQQLIINEENVADAVVISEETVV